MGTKKCVELGFGYGESEYKLNLVWHAGMESYRLPIRKTPEPFISPFRAEPGMDVKFELPAKSEVGKSKLGVLGHIYPEIKCQWLNLHFFCFRGGEIYIFFDLSIVLFSSPPSGMNSSRDSIPISFAYVATFSCLDSNKHCAAQ